MLIVIATGLTVLGVVGMSLYMPQTPQAVMMMLLLLTGFFQSISWTATNAFTFADVEDMKFLLTSSIVPA